MSKQGIIAFFKPSLFVIILMGIFTPVALIGHAQTYAFTCGGDGHKCVGTGIEKPLFYDVYRGYPFWPIWVMSIAPLIPFTTAIQTLLPDWEGMPYIFMAINYAYYYVGSCVLAFFWRKFRKIKWFDDPTQRVTS